MNNNYISKKTIFLFIFLANSIVLSLILFFYSPMPLEIDLDLTKIFSIKYASTVLFFLYGFAAWAFPINFFMIFLTIYFDNFSTISIFAHLLFPYFCSLFCAIYKYSGNFIYPAGGSIGQIFFELMIYYFPNNFKFIFYLSSIILTFFILRTKGTINILKIINFILIKLKIYNLFKFIYYNGISWIIFLIPKSKTILPETPYCIKKALNESIENDFEDIKLLYNLNSSIASYIAPFKIYAATNYKCETIKINDFDEILIINALKKNNINAELISSFVGPIITTVIIKPNENEKLSSIKNSEEEIARTLGKSELRINYPIKEFPFCIGLEFKSEKRESVEFIKNIHVINDFNNLDLILLLGINTKGKPFTINLSKLPHLLIAGTTGSGKSSIMHGLIMSILWKYSPDEVSIVLIDTKSVEFSDYENIPHLKYNIARKVNEINDVLNNILIEMNTRYSIFQSLKIKNIQDFFKNYPEKKNEFQYIVIFIDEYADLVMQNNDLEQYIVRLVQMARAAGIHIILSTQRPSADIISSVLKSNIPARIACRVSSAIDSRIILGVSGAEKLLGSGDMLFLDEFGEINRVHGVFLDLVNTEKIVSFIETQKKYIQ